MAEAPSGLHVSTEGRGPELALVHGWGLHGGIWETVAAELGDMYRVSRVDLPGHGRSPAAPGGLRDWATRLGDALPGPRVWVGWSLGGLLCLQLALQRPAQVRALVLVAATPRFTTAEDWPWAVAPDVLEDFAAALREDFPGTLGRFLALQVRGSAQAQVALRRLRESVARGPQPTELEAGLTILRQSDLRRSLGSVRCPVWLVGGERDTLVPAAAMEATAAELADAAVEILPGAGHAPFVARPEAFLAGLRRFLEAIHAQSTPDLRRGAP